MLSKFPTVTELVNGRVKFWTQAVWFQSPALLVPTRNPKARCTRSSLTGPSLFSQQPFPNAILWPCCFLNIPCSCKSPSLCSSCSHDLEGPSPTLALISPHPYLPHPTDNTCSFIKTQPNAHLSPQRYWSLPREKCSLLPLWLRGTANTLW